MIKQGVMIHPLCYAPRVRGTFSNLVEQPNLTRFIPTGVGMNRFYIK